MRKCASRHCRRRKSWACGLDAATAPRSGGVAAFGRRRSVFGVTLPAPEDLAADLRAFVDASPSPFHAVAEMARRLEAAGFEPLHEWDSWSLSPGDRRYVVRDGGSIIAFRLGSSPLAEVGARLIGAHTDSPTFKVRPRPDVRRVGYRLVGVEPYGGVLMHTWLDRELTLVGRVAVRTSDDDIDLRLVRLPAAPLRLPSLAIHLDRSVRDGLKLDPQRHIVPLWGPDLEGEAGLLEALAEAAGVAPDDVVGHDLITTDTQPAAVTGADGEWIAAPRLDNQGSCHAGTAALIEAADDPGEATIVLVANDHEEIGSGSAEGARGPFLSDVLDRLVTITDENDRQALPRALARSRLVSADMAHAVHPNFAEQHEPSHRPALGGGPVVKLNANQAYATDARSGAWFHVRCAAAWVPVQHFVSRADLPCGSTIGPLTATRTGIPTVDVGAPLLGLHSCRELVAGADVSLMVRALHSCLTG
jgi:aspartyl aminopeptidase